MGHVTAYNMCMSVKKDILLCPNTRNTVKSPDKGLEWVCIHVHWDYGFTHTEKHDGFGCV